MRNPQIPFALLPSSSRLPLHHKMEGGGTAVVDPPKPETQNPQYEAKAEQQPESRKRKLDDGAVDALRGSSYFKIRSIIRDLRPFFIEVINAPDFRESKAAHDIRKQMMTMIELTRQLRKEASVAKPDTGCQLPPQPPIGGAISNSSDNGEASGKKEEGIHGTYVIGGSPVGWNFLLYPGNQPIYYGETKASFRSRQNAKSA